MTAKYRFDDAYGKLYEYCPDQNDYIFVMSIDAKTEEEAIREYEKKTLDYCESDYNWYD